MLGALVFTSIISVVSSSMTFLNGSLAGRSYSSPSVTRFLSPETNTTIEAELINIDQDGCNARSRVDQSHVHGRAVYLAHPSGCSFEMNYDQFASMGVVALVVMDVYIPGGLGYNMHDGVVQYAHTGMLFVQLGYDEPLLAYLTSRPSGIHIRLSTDPNRWASTYASWPYATFLRWLPALIFTCSGTMAIRYLYGHVMLDLQKRRTTSGGRTPVLYDLVRLPNVALLIKMAEALILAIKFAMCGMLSTPAW